MTPQSATHRSAETRDREQISARDRVRRVSTETKASFKTTEFFAYLAVVIGLLIAGNAVEASEGGADYFAADKVWLYVTLLTIGYMVSRGLAKAGSREPYDDNR